MTIDYRIFGMSYKDEDSSSILDSYLTYIANEKLLYYKQIIHYGGKEGESLWTHIMNLITIAEKVRPLFDLTSDEMRCLLLALTIHDINKVPEHGKRADGKHLSYANAAAIKNLEKELETLDVGAFFPEWRDYLNDIKYLVDVHQVKGGQASQHDPRLLERCELDEDRLEGILRNLMRFTDATDNTHSGDYTDHSEKNIRTKLIGHLSAALYATGAPRRYRFVGHRLAELRGLFTNVMHNEIVAFFRETFGEEACIDLLYHPEGVDYLLDQSIQLPTGSELIPQLATRIAQKMAQLQNDQLGQFIKAKPSGVSVDDAAMQSGATLADIFHYIANTVERKKYQQDWWEQRQDLVRSDLAKALSTDNTQIQAQIASILNESQLLPSAEEALKRGEFLVAYRNFLKDHYADQLKAVKQDAWTRAYRLFQLPATADAIYQLIDPYRRGYFLARDLPVLSLDEIMQMALADLDQLEQEAREKTTRKGKANIQPVESPVEQQEVVELSQLATDLTDYLQRNLEIWDSTAGTTQTESVNFLDSLRRYSDTRRPDTQCCHCGNTLKASEWMAIQVPKSIGVQNFSNRLEGGSARDPKRNVCDVCRMQFILEKLAWRGHSDKHGKDQVTYYIHLFPYSFFTKPMLDAWWQSIKSFRSSDHTSLFLDTRTYFQQYQDAVDSNAYQQEKVRVYHRGIEGLGLPTFSDVMSNTPVLPLIVSGQNSSHKFVLALGKAVLLARWFGCRVLLSRLPTPLLNLGTEFIGEVPVAFSIENIPSAMEWLVPEQALTPPKLRQLHQRLHLLYQVSKLLGSGIEEEDRDIIYDLVSAAADDPLKMYHVADRLIEQQAGRRKGAQAEYQAIELSHAVAGLLAQLLKEHTHA